MAVQLSCRLEAIGERRVGSQQEATTSHSENQRHIMLTAGFDNSGYDL